jgi:hypothetical protein
LIPLRTGSYKQPAYLKDGEFLDYVTLLLAFLFHAVRRNKGKFVSVLNHGPRHEETRICGGTAPRILNFSSTESRGEQRVAFSSSFIPREISRYSMVRRLGGSQK